MRRRAWSTLPLTKSEAYPAWRFPGTNDTTIMIREAIALLVDGCVGRCDPPSGRRTIQCSSSDASG